MIDVLSSADISKEYEQTRQDNVHLLHVRREEIYNKIPRVKEIDRDIKLTHLSVVKLHIINDPNADEVSARADRKISELNQEKNSLLNSAGYPINYLEKIYTCKDCLDTGYINDKACHCRKAKVTEAIHKRSNLRSILEKENFDTFDINYYSKEPLQDKPSAYDNMLNNLNDAKSFVANFGDGSNLLLYGETGLGKTFLSNCIAKEVMSQGKTVLYLSAKQLFEEIIAGYKFHDRSDYEELNQNIYTSDLLIIDDLGTELTNNMIISELYEIINQRQISKKSVIISTNLSLRQLDQKYSERSMSRIFENYTLLNFYGENIRYQKCQQKMA